MEHLKTKCENCGAESGGLAFVRVPDELLGGWLAIIPLTKMGWPQCLLWTLHVCGSLAVGATMFWFSGFLMNPEWWRIAVVMAVTLAVEQGLLQLFLKSDIRRFKNFASGVAKFVRENEHVLAIERDVEFTIFPNSVTDRRPVVLMRGDGSVRVEIGTWFALVSSYGKTRFSWGTAL